jgi:hypothetical protein
VEVNEIGYAQYNYPYLGWCMSWPRPLLMDG